MIGAPMNWMLVLALSFILTLLPLPHFLSPMMPTWSLLVLLYTVSVWGMSWSWVAILWVGLMLDVMQVSVLGEHVLALTLGLWMTKLVPKPFQYYSIDQQMFWVGMVCLVYQVTLFILNGIFRGALTWPLLIQMCVGVLLSVVLWPWIQQFLENLLKPVSQPTRMRILDK
jgi:rod shape-determining protein MreD